MQIAGVLETSLYVADLERAEAFYRRVLELPLVSRQPGRHVFFQCGAGMLLLFDPQSSSRPDGDIPVHGAIGPGHAAFRIRADQVAAWRAELAEKGVAIEREIAWPQGGHSIYFRDPDGNSLELATPSLWGLPEDTG
jgi:catechol 2,3-dioxygenase-like lactoylglutathione lyase family enzyme